ncbi:MAG: hypothetical protein KGL15_00040 [Acidobacteriota bacterium]|nr:hypothetical protein [Acidobacteriota bacterium]
MSDPSSQIDLSSPRTNGQILDVAFRTYARRPLLFMFLTAIVLIPYGAVVVLVAQSKHVAAATELLLALAELALVNPVIAALQMQALLDLGDGRRPQISDVIARGLRVLAVVAAADIIAGICEVAGLFFFVIPGVFAAVRLAVAAPVAATEGITWPEAIRRSLELTQGNFWRVLVLLAIQAVLTYIVALILGAGSVAGVAVGALLAVLAQSFCMLLINLLYFDLRARQTAPVG